MKFWFCPRCGLSVQDEPWRHVDANRTICQNQHAKTQMILQEKIRMKEGGIYS